MDRDDAQNREMRRIVGGLRDPDQPPEQLLGVLTVRRADGREFSVEELPLAQALSAGETVRAEETNTTNRDVVGLPELLLVSDRAVGATADEVAQLAGLPHQVQRYVPGGSPTSRVMSMSKPISLGEKLSAGSRTAAS